MKLTHSQGCPFGTTTTAEPEPTTRPTQAPTTAHSEKCYGCLQIGGPPDANGNNVPIESLITNINANPVPVLLRCVGPENPDKEDVFNGNGRAILDAFCDYNENGIPEEGEFHRQLLIKE